MKRLQLELDQQNVLLDRLRAALPEAIRSRLVAARCSGDDLALYCDSSAWSTRLRFYAPDLLAAVSDFRPKPKRARVRIHLPDSRSASPSTRVAGLSASAAATIAATAQNITDPELRAALLRLAGR